MYTECMDPPSVLQMQFDVQSARGGGWGRKIGVLLLLWQVQRFVCVQTTRWRRVDDYPRTK